MRIRDLLGFFLLLMPMAVYAQNLYPRKDLAFAQIAAGGGYETILNVTNRGTTNYNGVLKLFRTPAGQTTPQAWNPVVNGNPITGGQLTIAVAKGATASFQITLPGGTEAGFAVIKASGQEQTDFLEGTLTYYVTSGATLTDSVGVQPSSEFYLTTIPFDDFSTLALALANANTTRAAVQLTVFSETNVQAAPPVSQTLEPNQHIPQYLWQFFPGLQIQKGRLEIRSDLPVLGTALTDKSGQFSSLPLLPAVKAYTFSSTVGGVTFSGELSLWIDGPHVQGYLRTLMVGGVPEQKIDTIYLSGNLADKVLQLYTSGRPGEGQNLSYMLVNPFSLSQTAVEGSATVWLLDNLTLVGQGKLTMTAIN